MSERPPLSAAVGPTPGPGPLSLVLLLAAAGCSTREQPSTAMECTELSCGEGFVCHLGRCLSNDEAAPRAHLGFDVRERVGNSIRFRAEVDGCDCTVQESFRELALRRSRVSQTFDLQVSNPQLPGDAVFPATFELSQPTRYGLHSSPMVSTAEFPLAEAMRWPRFHPLDQDVQSDIIMWKVQPMDGSAHRYVGLVPPDTIAGASCEVDADCCEPKGACNPAPNFCDPTVGECTAVGQPEWIYHYVYEPECSRTIEGTVVPIDPVSFVVLDEDPAKALTNPSVLLRYADGDEPFGMPVFGQVPLEQPHECDDDGDCNAPVEFCEPVSHQCFVALDGWPAADRRSATVGQGQFAAEVYTYCDAPGAGDALERSYTVTVDPQQGAHPTVDYRIDASFSPNFVAGQFCVPDWGEGQSLEIEFVGQPRPLVSGDPAYTCCDVGCLPATATAAEVPPVASTRCDGRTTAGAPPEVMVTSHFVLDDLEAWAEADCAPPNPDARGRLGSLSRQAQCTTPETPCLVDDVAVGTAESPRRYEVRIESPMGLVVASGDFVVELGPGPPEVQTIELAPRVLVTGVVDVDQALCDLRGTNDCAAREAIVLAERIRMPDEPEGSVPGPYFHNVSTFYDPTTQRDGAFVLPLDPGGVYVVTAMPVGSEGGPSRFQVVNLRSDASTELQPLRLVLEEGVVVTVRLEQFDQRTTVIPMDRGSFLTESQAMVHPARAGTADPFVDLNREGECWARPEAPGCQIRRLIPPGSDLARSQAGVARFTARRSDGSECTNVCPQIDPPE